MIEEKIKAVGIKMQASENRHYRGGARATVSNSKLEDKVEENIPALKVLRCNTGF